MRPRTPAVRLRSALVGTLILGAVLLGAAACGDDAARIDPAGPHAHTGLPAGDGTRSSYVGYSLTDSTFPTKAGEPGTYSFRIDTFRGTPLTDYITELTRDMHVYVVSKDLSVFRHLHPTMAADGTWSGMLTVPQDGQYRLITEFTAKDDGGNGDQLVLGVEHRVGQAPQPTPLPPTSASATVDGITLEVASALAVGNENEMTLALSRDEAAASLGTYLGVYAHVSAFRAETGELVHMHPLGTPTTRDGQSVLDFHTGFKLPGEYRMFVQTRISGVVRTIPITVTVAA